MATDPHKREFRIRELSTRSVLLFPTRAQIIRDIKDIALQPGLNQIIIDGLGPTVDEHSIKVEGTGAATINEVTVDLLPNRDLYEDIYPSDSGEDDDEEESESEVEAESMKTIVAKLKQLKTDLLAENENTNSAANRLRICENFGQSVVTNRPPPAELENLLKAYNEERQKIFTEHAASVAAADKIQQQIKQCEKEQTKLAKSLVKAQQKFRKEKAKLKDKKLRKKAEAHKEKLRIKAERESFWPKKVYRITISLEPTFMTPDSSRRSSIDGDTVVNVNLASTTFHEPSKVLPGEISLSLSYITYSASWSPRYDLSLDSTKHTGVLDYGAELKNTTSEIWRDAKVILSTSQTTFSGLSETIPTLYPWHVRLQKGQRNSDLALFSQHEINTKRAEHQNTSTQFQRPRHENFGVDSNTQNLYLAEQNKLANDRKEKEAASVNSFLNRSVVPSSQAIFGAGFGSSSSLFSSNAPIRHARRAHGFERMSSHGAEAEVDLESEQEEDGDNGEMGYALFDSPGTGTPATNSLAFEEGAWEETGLTTTYDVPGTKTLAPSNSTIKHKIAKVAFQNVIFSHIIIGKLRQVAFLKARLRNTSRITLLRGPLGLTLDGSFLGQATFPRCSSGEAFSLPLGVDPAIQIAYPKPTVRRSQSGIFSKEDSNVFTRTIIITNTKHNTAVELTVLDQVPVSEDERLKIEITNPRGLRVGGDKVRAGTNASDPNMVVAAPKQPAATSAGIAQAARASVYNAASGQEIASKGNWGQAEATAKKGGEVAWSVKLMPGCAVKLALEYELTYPATEGVVSN